MSNLALGKYIKLCCSDTGHGISPENIGRIFEPYFTTKKQGQGIEMGLAVVEGIVKVHKGQIMVMSQQQKGTAFTVFLPMLENYEPAPGPISQDVQPGGTEHIFLIDDEMPIVKLYKMALERFGYKVTTRTGSLGALDAFRAAPGMFDLVITDMAMPNITGAVLAAELIKIRPDIPVIVCTGYSDRLSEESGSKHLRANLSV